MEKVSAELYVKENEGANHLPDFLQDFHDQKSFFKAMQEWASKNESFQKLPNTWVDNHVYTIDFFLWFMALHGYKLQKARAKNVMFYSIRETIKEYCDRISKSFIDAFNKRLEEKDCTQSN